jgi:hypothetical protein
MEAALSQLHSGHEEAPLYALSAEFGSPEAVIAAANALRPRGFGRLEIYSPVPIPGAVEAIGRQAQPIPYYFVAGAALFGFVAMMGMCVYATAYDYRFQIGGRPLFSWPAYAVPSVSFAMLTGALAAFFNMTFLTRLPLLNHPSFNIPGFGRASQDRFFLMVAATEAPLDPVAIERALNGLGSKPIAMARVPR